MSNHGSCLIFLLLLFIPLFHCHEGHFEGQEHWIQSGLEMCKRTNNGPSTNDLRCYWVFDKMHIFKVEVLSKSPVILRYHKLIHRRQCQRIVNEVAEMKLEKAGINLHLKPVTAGRAGESVVSFDPKLANRIMKNRMANSTWTPHRERVNFNNLFNQLQRTLLTLDISKAEDFQVLSYDKDGHYAPHYDFLEQGSSASTVNTEGNRVATVLTILQTAKLGGTTAFLRLGINIRPIAGDVLVWHNQNGEGARDDETLHAACPILEGTKIGATLWIRSFGQELRLKCNFKKHLSIDGYVRPSMKPEDVPMFARGPGPKI